MPGDPRPDRRGPRTPRVGTALGGRAVRPCVRPAARRVAALHPPRTAAAVAVAGLRPAAAAVGGAAPGGAGGTADRALRAKAGRNRPGLGVDNGGDPRAYTP